MLTPDGNVYHWASDRFWLQTEIDAEEIESTELASIARPGGFLEPLQATLNAVCVDSFLELEARRQNPSAARPPANNPIPGLFAGGGEILRLARPASRSSGCLSGRSPW